MTKAGNSQIMRTITLLITIFSLSFPAYAKYSGGTGEPNDPYQIATAEDLITLGETPEDYDKHFILTADIDLDPNLPGRKVFDRAVIAPDMDPSEGGSSGPCFTGVFDGGGHSISHLTIDGHDNVGLFGESSGWIKDLGLVDISITGSSVSVGGLVGWNSGRVTLCYSTGSVSGSKRRVGGLAGVNDGILMECYSAASVKGRDDVGGLVGWNVSTVTQCHSTGAVTGDTGVGGLIGMNDHRESIYGTVIFCYSTGTVSGSEAIGGLIGENGGDVSRCYSAGAVTGSGERVGGMVGSGSVQRGGDMGYEFVGTVTASFWDIQTSGQAASDGGIGMTTAEMQTASTFFDAGWDFVDETANGTEDIWKIAEGIGYPRLAWEKYSGGTGEPNDPYQIATAADLIAFGETPEDYDKHFILTADIDLDPNLPGGKVFDRAVVQYFSGVFVGNGHVISHLRVLGEGYLGLFGKLSGKVRSLGLAEVSIHGSGDYVGALAGSNDGYVTQCYSTGSVSGNNRVGGLVGSNETEGSLANCWSMGLVRGVCWYPMSWYLGNGVGGLAGANWGTIESCYSAAATSGNHEYVGGLVGENILHPMIDGSIVMGRVVACFGDTETSGQAMTPWSAGTGKTTAEMQMASTFLEAGWDFLAEIENGLHETWKMPEGGGYPVLAIFNGYTPPVLKGLGTAESPYIISDANELGAIIHYSASAHYRLLASIDLSGVHWTTTVIPSFSGTFDGNSHSISHLTISGDSYVGMFGKLESGAEIRRLGIVDVNIAGSYEYAGGLAAYNEYSTVTQCYSTGIVRGSDYVGGLMGWNGSGEVSYSYSSATGIGNDHVAGLVGVSSSLLGPHASVNHCYSTGSVSSYFTGPFSRERPGPSVGGLVSHHNEHYSGSVIACFWDTQTSGQTDSDGGTGKTTAEMQTASTFLEAGWDFVGETENGTEDIWWILEGQDYPRLWWEAE